MGQPDDGVITTSYGPPTKSNDLSPENSKFTRNSTLPELLAAAHAGSFSMTLAGELRKASFGPEEIEATVTITMGGVTRGCELIRIHLDVIATVPAATQCDFISATIIAKTNYPVFSLLKGNASMNARLNSVASGSANDTAPGSGPGFPRNNLGKDEIQT